MDCHLKNPLVSPSSGEVETPISAYPNPLASLTPLNIHCSQPFSLLDFYFLVCVVSVLFLFTDSET